MCVFCASRFLRSDYKCRGLSVQYEELACSGRNLDCGFCWMWRPLALNQCQACSKIGGHQQLRLLHDHASNDLSWNWKDETWGKHTTQALAYFLALLIKRLVCRGAGSASSPCFIIFGWQGKCTNPCRACADWLHQWWTYFEFVHFDCQVLSENGTTNLRRTFWDVQLHLLSFSAGWRWCGVERAYDNVDNAPVHRRYSSDCKLLRVCRDALNSLEVTDLDQEVQNALVFRRQAGFKSA